VQVLRDVGSTVALHFFCSQHVASIDDLKGPRGLIRSLLAQLVLTILRNQPDNLLDTDDAIPTEGFCQLFQHLLRRIPAHVTVLCLIDDITRLERDSWSEDYKSLMNMLNGIIFDQEIRARFKVLMTSPTKSRWLQNTLTPAHRIDLRGGGTSICPGTEQSLWTAAQQYSLSL
jgi:hypothetical protein